MGDAAPVVGHGEILLPGELLAGEHIPQPELRLQTAVGLTGDAAGDQRLRVDGAPIGEARQRVDVGDALDVGRRIDRREQAGALEIGGDHLRDIARDVAVVRLPPTKSGSAIGIGWTLPWVTSMLTTARGRSETGQRARGDAAAPASSVRRLSRPAPLESRQSRSLACSILKSASSAAEHIARIEGDLDVFPELVVLGPTAC